MPNAHAAASTTTHRLPLGEPPAILTATIDGLRASVLRWLPESAFRKFYLRMLDPASDTHAAFIQIAAISQLATLTAELLGDLAETPAQADRLLSASMRMNAWQVHEVVSDNLALGLGHPAELDRPEEQARRRLLRGFNAAMSARLRGEDATAMPVFRDLAGTDVAIGRSSLVPAVHASLIAQFSAWSGISGGEVEAAAPDQLTANIESCVDMLDGMTDMPLAGAVRVSLIGRYDGVDELLRSPDLSFERLLALGTDSILVMPTLGYYVDALASCLDLGPRLAAVIEDRSLLDALETAALLVRLLNDIGTDLLTMAPSRHHELLGTLRRAIAEAAPTVPLVQAWRGPRIADPALTRLRKDIEHDEFNLLLHGIGHRRPAAGTVGAFIARLDKAVTAFADGTRRLDALLQRLEQRMGDDRPALLIRRFVGFHERLYRHAYDSRSGDYAIY